MIHKGKTVLKLLFVSAIMIPGIMKWATAHGSGANRLKTAGYSTFQDTSAAFKLSKEDSAALQMPFSLNESVNAQVAYMRNCHMCHGVDRMGASGPSLYHLNNRINFNYFKNIVSIGRAQMPGFRLLDSKTLIALYKYLSDLPVNDVSKKPAGKRSEEK
jgi:quinoprotein glucose dehydrogenase